MYGVRGLSGKLNVSPSYVSMLVSDQRKLTQELEEKLLVFTELATTGGGGVHKTVHSRGNGSGQLDGKTRSKGVWWALLDNRQNLFVDFHLT